MKPGMVGIAGMYHEVFWSTLGGIAAVVAAGQVLGTAVALRAYWTAVRGLPGWWLYRALTRTVEIVVPPLEKYSSELAEAHRNYPGNLQRRDFQRDIPGGLRVRFAVVWLLGSCWYVAQGMVMIQCLNSLADKADDLSPHIAIWLEVSVVVTAPIVLSLTDTVGGRLKQLSEEPHRPPQRLSRAVAQATRHEGAVHDPPPD